MEYYNLQIDMYKPLREVVFDSIRGAILSGALKPGERLMEVKMADKLGVSRTPIREAIRKLELEGLVVMVPRKGVYIADLSIKDIRDVLEIRIVMEELAARLAAERISDEDIEELMQAAKDFDEATKTDDIELLIRKDIEFHDKIFKATNNEKLVILTNNLREQVQRYRIMFLKKTENKEQLTKEHYEIAEAIKERDSKKSAELAKKHIELVEFNTLKMVDKV